MSLSFSPGCHQLLAYHISLTSADSLSPEALTGLTKSLAINLRSHHYGKSTQESGGRGKTIVKFLASNIRWCAGPISSFTTELYRLVEQRYTQIKMKGEQQQL